MPDTQSRQNILCSTYCLAVNPQLLFHLYSAEVGVDCEGRQKTVEWEAQWMNSAQELKAIALRLRPDRTSECLGLQREHLTASL